LELFELFELRARLVERFAAPEEFFALEEEREPLDAERERVFGADPLPADPERPDALLLERCGDFCVFWAISDPPIDPCD